MKYFISKVLIISILASSSVALADGDHAAPKVETKFSEHSAVTDFNPEEGFKMNEVALKSLGVQFKKIEGSAPWSIPKESLVQIKHTTGIYRRFEGWISFVLVTVTNKSNAVATIKSEDLEPGDEVAISGASFLRMTEADLNSDTVDSCAH